ncbi:MAG: DUF3365 domain-containing protein [Proteobacteria bacterium]|nr:DUF3365 domain-containing protein [Pseudomonadota bacterium]MBU4010346.1 DUF3365 domain-containing protein [Pseudomonadota bacterium]MBU4036983.1 DUF3365 domain-containing protein [Pseudomonadota bacterium]
MHKAAFIRNGLKSHLRDSGLLRYMWIIAGVWTMIIVATVLINAISIRREFYGMARIVAMASFNKDMVYRRWAANQGGVYVPVTDENQLNSYLSDIPDRDITSTTGRLLTLINSAYMTRQVHELGMKQYGLRGHITSLKPTRPETAPDLWETKALKAFGQGEIEVTDMQIIDGSPHFRFMRPMFTEKACLRCHAKQGYKEGDIRGGISVSVPMAPYQAAARSQAIYLSAAFGLVWLIGLVAIFLGINRFGLRIREKEQVQEERNRYLDKLQKSLETGKELSGLLPICASCKKIRDDKGYWQQVETYVREHSEADFTHGICPDCEKELFEDIPKR